ncbi:hypothetical protein ACE6H2_009193 [Prunus campanulata]
MAASFPLLKLQEMVAFLLELCINQTVSFLSGSYDYERYLAPLPSLLLSGNHSFTMSGDHGNIMICSQSLVDGYWCS